MADKSIHIDKDLRPAYWDDFHCLAADCKISCCKGWGIPFNKKDYLSLKRQEGSAELNALLESGVRRIRKGPNAGKYYGEFDMDSGVCPFLGEDSLCCLQKEKSHDALPHVCRSYPRSEDYMPSGYLERSLSPACEGVLALLWDLPDGIEFRSDPLPKEQWRKINTDEGNPLPVWFSVVREWCIDVMQDRRFPLPQRIFLMGMALHELADGEEDIERWMKRAAALQNSVGASIHLPDSEQELGMYLSNCIHTLLKLPAGNTNRENIREALLDGMKVKPNADTKKYTTTTEPYREARARYDEQFRDRDYFMENLMLAIFFRLKVPHIESREDLWKSYVNFCNLYGFYRFLAVMSCREGSAGGRDELFRLVVFASRELLHNGRRQSQLRDDYFKSDSATLAHMAILLCG